jgi:hypothetical protein
MGIMPKELGGRKARSKWWIALAILKAQTLEVFISTMAHCCLFLSRPVVRSKKPGWGLDPKLEILGGFLTDLRVIPTMQDGLGEDH